MRLILSSPILRILPEKSISRCWFRSITSIPKVPCSPISTCLVKQKHRMFVTRNEKTRILLIKSNLVLSHKSNFCTNPTNSPPDDDESTSDDGEPVRKSTKSCMFYDSLRIFVKAGHGGQGLPKMGGIGGNGGNVFVVGNEKVTLKKLYEKYPDKRFHAKPGADSKLFCLYGEPGKSIIIPVPLGVSLITELGHKIGEINAPMEKLLLAKGGVGGSPGNGYSAQAGHSFNLSLDLKLIADVGFVGFPNAGKSTLLKALSRASPKIASYPFTTIRPNIGIVEYSDYRQISLADLPGLIEGAHANVGMGHKFLKHVERTKVLLFVVDMHGFQLSPRHPKRSALETIVLLNKELELYKEELTEKPAILALNKSDLQGSYEVLREVQETLGNQNSYETFLKTLPKEFIPENIMMFDRILPISAAKDPVSVSELKSKIRSAIDINDRSQNFNNNFVSVHDRTN